MTKNTLIVLALIFSLVGAVPCISAPGSGSTGGGPNAPDMKRIDEYMVYVQLRDGRLMGIIGHAIKGIAMARYSADGGYTWSENQPLFAYPKDTGSWGIEQAFLGLDGEVHAVVHNYPANQPRDLYKMRFDIWSVRSTDDIKNWEPPRLVWEGYSGSLLSVTQLRNGRIIIPFCYLTPRTWAKRGTGLDAFTFMGRFSSSAAYSDDDGDTWHTSSSELKEPTAYIGADGGIEPIVIQRKDGSVWMLIRTQDDYFFQSNSADGSNWSLPLPTPIISSDSPAGLLRLKDGRILLFWNNTQRYSYANGGRAVLHAAVSSDEGRTWRGYREVARNPLCVEPPPPNGDHGVTYTVPALTKEGDAVTSLSTGPGGGEYILHLNPNWLDETVQKDDFSSGLDQWSTFGTRGVSLAPNPNQPGKMALEIRKADPEWPAAAVWNYPMGRKGDLRLRLLLKPGFAGARIGITDHFSVPLDPLDVNYNLYNLAIGSAGEVSSSSRLRLGHWYTVDIEWDGDKSQARVIADGKFIADIPQTRMSVGASYLRVVSTAPAGPDAGLLIESVRADVSAGWRH